MPSSRFRVAKQVITVNVANGQATGNGDVTFLNGILRSISINCPVLTSANYSLVITGPATGFTILSKPTLTPNAVTNFISDGTGLPTGGIAVDANTSITINTTGAEGAPRVIPITVLIDKG